MKAATKKWTHAGLIALVGVCTDIGAQLSAGTLNLTRAVLVGLVMGSLGRVVGAVLAAIATTEPSDGGSTGG